MNFWRSEARILSDREARKEKLPDALLDLPEGLRVIEFGGSYSKSKLEHFHAYCEEQGFPYEVW